MASFFPPRREPVEDLVCRLAESDGYGGSAPGSELCRDPADILDFHLDAQGEFWVCFSDFCREGTYEEAVYLLGGKREVEGA
jgi:hypothetical protein